MAFVLNQFAPLGNASRPRRTGSGGGAPVGWTYFHASDNLATVKGSGYFDEVAHMVNAGDFIFFSANGASVDIITIAAITSGVVTSQTNDINSA